LAGCGPANPKSEARNPKQTESPNAQNPIADDVSAAPNKANFLLFGPKNAGDEKRQSQSGLPGR
jgi:hypothetical protein